MSLLQVNLSETKAMTAENSPRDPLKEAEQRSAAIAGHQGDSTTARQLFQSEDDRVRATALGALQRIGTLTADELHAGLHDPSPRVRRRALTIATTHPDVEIIGLLHDDDPAVAEVAAWSCGERTTVANVKAVVTDLISMATNHEDPLCREAAVASLGALGDERSVDAILAGLADVPQIRRRAALALAPFDGPHIIAALEAATSDKDWQVRQAAEDILGR